MATKKKPKSKVEKIYLIGITDLAVKYGVSETWLDERIKDCGGTPNKVTRKMVLDEFQSYFDLDWDTHQLAIVGDKLIWLKWDEERQDGIEGTNDGDFTNEVWDGYWDSISANDEFVDALINGEPDELEASFPKPITKAKLKLQFRPIELPSPLIDKVIEQMKDDIADGDCTAIEELLTLVPEEYLKGYLPEE